MKKKRELKVRTNLLNLESLTLKKTLRIVRFTVFYFFLGLVQVMAIDSYSQPNKLSPDVNNETSENVNKTIKGKIIDEKGQPLPGVTVFVKGTTIGTTTSVDGTYSLSNIPDNATLIFSFIGMKTQEVKVGNQTKIDVTMVVSSIGIEEVVTIGYGTQKKVNVTGAVATVSNETLRNRPLPRVGEVLRGVSPNLNVSLSSAGGEPGAESDWNIRGLGSINGKTSPLILVDGVEMDITNLDPSNIENISVLKDASASAIYGSRAPFGVILITTKSGRKDGTVSVQYNNNFGFGTPMGIGHLENSMVYATAYNQAATNTGTTPMYDEEYLARIQGYLDGTYKTEYDPENPPDYIWGGRRVGNANYDWPYEWVKTLKMDHQHSLNVSGGSEKTQYYTSIGYFDQDGFLVYGNDDYKRIDFLVNLKSQVTDWLSFNISSKFANTHTDHPVGITTVTREYQWLSLYQWSPMTPKYNINGSIQNPWIRQQQGAGREKEVKNNLLLTAGTEIEPLKGWKTNVSYSYRLGVANSESNPKPVMVELGTGGFGNVGKPNATYETLFAHSTYSLFNVVSNYEKTIGSHYFKVLAGYEREEELYSKLLGKGGTLISEAVPSISTSLGTTMVDDTKWDWAAEGYFGRFNYNYKEKYLLEISARYNGSSKFAPDSRWGFFPSGSVGWQVSKEGFWSGIKKYVNTLKVRGSYGSLGNQNVASYMYIPSVPIQSETPWIINDERPPYAQTPDLISSSLTWETITTTNIGVDASFLDNRLEFNFDWFSRYTSEMFGPSETLPYPLGTSAPKSNNAEMETKGFEVILKWKDRVSSDFSYDVQFTLGDAKSTIIKYRNEQGFIDEGSWYAGKEVGEVWGYITDGIIQTQEEADAMVDQSAIYKRWGPGDMKYKDVNGDGKITRGNETLNDHGDLVVIANTTPRYNVGILGGFKWKNFDFNMQWFGTLKRDYLPGLDYWGNKLFNGLSKTWAVSGIIKGSKTLDYWRPADETNMFGPNTDSYFPKPYFSDEVYKNRETQSKYVLNAAFLRMKFVQVGYTLPKSLSKRLSISSARIFVSGENLLTIQSMLKTLDPESSVKEGVQTWTDPNNPRPITDGGFYPMAKTYSVGVNVTF